MTSARGRLEEQDLPAVLRPLVRARRTGPLRLARGGVSKTIYLSEGRVIFATSTDPDDRLGEMLLRKGLITYRALEESVAAIRAGKRQGTLLVESGAIRSRHLVEGVTEQVQEIVYGLFQWEDGEWSFEDGDLPSREVIVLRMSTADLVLEGVRRIQRWTRIRDGVGGLAQRYALAPGAHAVMSQLSLRSEELSLVAGLDGVMTLEDLCAVSPDPDFQVCRSVWALWAAALLDRVPQDREEESPRQERTAPNADVRGASIGREIERFNELHRFLFELVAWDLREKAAAFFERAFQQAAAEHRVLFEGVAVDPQGELDGLALRRNIVSFDVPRYVAGLDRLLAIEVDLAREVMGDKKAGILQDGLLALKEDQLKRAK